MRLRLSLALLLAASHSSFAASAGDPEKGRALAERWCSSCHVVAPDQASATTEAPPFETIATRPVHDLEKLRAFLAAPHAPMPPLDLSRTEIGDLYAYIESLRPSE